MRYYGEMRVQGSGPLDGARFDALAYALAEIEQTDPAVDDVDLTASLAQGWVTASMVIEQGNLEQAVAKLIATVRTAIFPNGDIAGNWKFLTETAGLSIRPADRAATEAGATAARAPASAPDGPAQPAAGGALAQPAPSGGAHAAPGGGAHAVPGGWVPSVTGAPVSATPGRG